MRTDKNSGPSWTVRLSISGKQTDPEGNTQENTARHQAVCRAEGGGWLLTYREKGLPSRLYLSRSLVWMERGGLQRENSSFRKEPGEPLQRDAGFRKGPGESLREGGGTRMVFDPAVSETQCLYETPFGRIPMQIHTKSIAVLGGGRQAVPGPGPAAAEVPASAGEERKEPAAAFRLTARIHYTLRMDADYALTCAVTIRAVL